MLTESNRFETIRSDDQRSELYRAFASVVFRLLHNNSDLDQLRSLMSRASRAERIAQNMFRRYRAIDENFRRDYINPALQHDVVKTVQRFSLLCRAIQNVYTTYRRRLSDITRQRLAGLLVGIVGYFISNDRDMYAQSEQARPSYVKETDPNVYRSWLRVGEPIACMEALRAIEARHLWDARVTLNSLYQQISRRSHDDDRHEGPQLLLSRILQSMGP